MADIGCAGILVSDLFCGPMRELPREGQLLAVADMPIHAGGCAANVALDLVKQGLAVDIAGCLGRDTAGDGVRTTLEMQGIGCEHLAYSDQSPTSKTVILLVDGQDRRYIHSFGANGDFTVSQIDRDWVAGLKVFYLGGLCAMPGFAWDECAALLQFCREHGVITVVDVVVPQNFTAHDELSALLPHIDWFLPNDDEAALLTGLTDPLAQAHALQERGARAVVITLGKEGSVACRQESCWRSAACEMVVIDPSGAGDAFAAGVITGIARGWEMAETLRYASALGASATQAIGTTGGVFTAEQAAEFLTEHPLDVDQLIVEKTKGT